MKPLAMLWTDIRILLVDTTRIWWRLLPKILAIYLLGWLGYEVALQVAIIAGNVSAWLALLIFAFSFVAKLAAVVLILRLVGNTLGIRRLIPSEEVEDDDRDSGITRLLAVTLLPFLGIYTAFGLVADASDQMLIEDWFRKGGAFAADSSIVSRLRLSGPDGISTSRLVLVITIVVGTYILRRVIDALHERTGWRPLGIVVTFIESFFVLVTLTAGADLFAQVKFWFSDRRFLQWLHSAADAISGWVDSWGIDLPAVFGAVAGFIGDQIWPVITSGLSEPIFWLAIAALVYGSSVISVAELWRKGQPLASRVRVARRVLERSAREQQARTGAGSRARRAVFTEAKEAFFGDIDDKYLPTLHSLRLILRAGFIFLGAYVVVYGLQTVAKEGFTWLTHRTIGGHEFIFWEVWLPGIDLAQDLPFEPWRLCLLAVALRRCLLIFRMRAEERGTVVPQSGLLNARQAAAAQLESHGVAVPEQVRA